ncbi:MAG TPA: hypothetical protein VGJ15_00530 [Pirellulales bacterium]
MRLGVQANLKSCHGLKWTILDHNRRIQRRRKITTTGTTGTTLVN